MFNAFDNSHGGSTHRHGESADSHRHSHHASKHGKAVGSGFSKVFRWQPSDPKAPAPVAVEIVGSFNNWHPTPLLRHAADNSWQATVHGIPGHRTHHYMLLVDGQPASDKNSNGLAIPENPNEAKYQLMTARGPRVFLLFAQTK
jgi:hypothetical protein